MTIALGDKPGGGTFGGTLTMPVVNGVATFSGLMLDLAGVGYTFQVSSGSLLAATIDPLTVTPGGVAQFVVTGQPSATATAGQVLSFSRYSPLKMSTAISSRTITARW